MEQGFPILPRGQSLVGLDFLGITSYSEFKSPPHTGRRRPREKESNTEALWPLTHDGSMGLVYLPTFTINLSLTYIYIYHTWILWVMMNWFGVVYNLQTCSSAQNLSRCDEGAATRNCWLIRVGKTFTFAQWLSSPKHERSLKWKWKLTFTLYI